MVIAAFVVWDTLYFKFVQFFSLSGLLMSFSVVVIGKDRPYGFN